MRTCEIVEDGVVCGDTTQVRRGMCAMHYTRARRHGNPLTVRTVTETCTVVEDGVPCLGKHYAKAMCQKHYERLVRHGDPLVRLSPSTEFQTDTPTYSGAHQRVYRAKGKAAGHDCVDCNGPASEWSYDHSDPNELREMKTHKGNQYEFPYSVNPDHYEPRCKPCHLAYDKLTTEQPTTQEVTQ